MIIFLILKTIHTLISPLDTKYFNPNEIGEGFECLPKSGFSVLRVNIRIINKNFEKNFYSKLNFTFSIICFSETWATDNSICNDSNFQIESYTVLHRVRESDRGGGLSMVLHKEIYFKPRTELSINSNDVRHSVLKYTTKRIKIFYLV